MSAMFSSIKSFGIKCKRVWLVLKKPTKDEVLLISKVSAIGIGIIGAFGFILATFTGLFF